MLRGMLIVGLWGSATILGCTTKDSDTADTAASNVNAVDLLFVMDNSPSMIGEAEALAMSIETLTSRLDLAGVDYQLGITTTSVETSGAPGDAGDLVGVTRILSASDADVSASFSQNLACEAVCWKECYSDTERDETGDCIEESDDGSTGAITTTYLDETCGLDAWRSHCGSGNEEPIEAALLALCRASTSPPDACFDTITNLTASDAGTNDGLLRPNTPTYVIVLSDEGDSSRRLETGEVDISAYLVPFDELTSELTFAILGPPFAPDDTSYTCIGGAQPWGVERFYNITNETNGFYRGLWSSDLDSDGSCDYTTTSFEPHLVALADHILGE